VPRSAAPPASATCGIRSAATTSIYSIPCRGSAPASPARARPPPPPAAAPPRRRRAAVAAGRDPASVGVGYRVKRYGAAVPPVATDGERRLFSGSEGDIVGDPRALRELGVTALDIDFGRPDAAAVIAEMRRFRAAVIEKM